MADKIFADGFHYEPKEIEKAPWIKGQISVRVNDAIAFLQKHKNERGFVTIDVKVGKSGSWYCELNTWKPNMEVKENTEPDSIPF